MNIRDDFFPDALTICADPLDHRVSERLAKQQAGLPELPLGDGFMAAPPTFETTGQQEQPEDLAQLPGLSMGVRR